MNSLQFRPVKKGGFLFALEFAIGIPLVISIKKYTVYNMQSVTSNAVNKCLSMSYEEKEAGEYFGGKMYHKTFIFSSYVTLNTTCVLANNFEVPYNKAVDATAFIISNNGAWSNDVRIYLLFDGTLAIKSTDLGNNYFSVVIDFYYVK